MKTAERIIKKRDRIFNEWVDWSDYIQGEIAHLTRKRNIYRETINLMRGRNIHKSNEFYKYIKVTYADSVLMNVRRLVDTRNDVISFLRLLGDIRCNLKILSRKRFIAKVIYLNNCYEPAGNISKKQQQAFEMKAKLEANQNFNKYSGNGEEYINQDIVNKDIEKLKEKADKLKKYTNKWVAHHAKSNVQKNRISTPSDGELDSFISVLEELFKKYHLLLRGEEYQFTKLNEKWKNIFHKAWLE